MNRVYMYLLILLLVIPLPVAGYQYVMHRRAAFTGATDYTADANCVGAWYMNGASASSETDRSANGYTLTLGGADNPSGSNVPSDYSGLSRRWDESSSEYMYSTSLEVAGVNQHITGACWVYFLGMTNKAAILSAWNSLSDDRSWQFIYKTDPILRVQMSTDGIVTTPQHDITFPTTLTSSWVHIAFTYDDVQTIIYTNAVAVSTNAYTGGMFDSIADFNVGANLDGSASYLEGRIDEVIVFDRALSDAEILEIYTSGIDGTKGGND